MKLSSESRYGLVGLAYLATRPAGALVRSGELAEEARVPAMFLAKTLGKLARVGILRSARGREGGFALARPAGEISIREVLEAIEGADLFECCLLWGERTDEGHCSLHEAFSAVKPVAKSALDELSLEEYARSTVSVPSPA